jgi:hypothetical protein
MSWMHRLAPAALGAACLLVVAAPAGARPPRGYQQVSSNQIASAPGVVAEGHVTCPPGTVPLGGGSVIASSSPDVAIDGLVPLPDGWTARISNRSGAATNFDVRAICAKAPRKYVVVQSTFVVPAIMEGEVSVACPQGTQPLAGGGFWNDPSIARNLTDSFPSGRFWSVDGANNTAFDANLTAVAVCGKLKGRIVVQGMGIQVPDQGHGTAIATCPAPTVPVGGGAFAPFDLLATLGGTQFAVTVNGWVATENNVTGGTIFMAPIAVCAGT